MFVPAVVVIDNLVTGMQAVVIAQIDRIICRVNRRGRIKTRIYVTNPELPRIHCHIGPCSQCVTSAFGPRKASVVFVITVTRRAPTLVEPETVRLPEITLRLVVSEALTTTLPSANTTAVSVPLGAIAASVVKL